MQKILFLFFCLLSASAQGQGAYCTENLYINNWNCNIRVNQTGDTVWKGTFEDFSIWGEGGSVLEDLATGCPTFTPGVPFSPGFSDRTHLPPVEVSAGGEYTARMLVVSGVHFQSINKRDFYFGNAFLRIDFNQNFVFDTTENILKPTADTTFEDHFLYDLQFGAAPRPVDFKIRIPATVDTGTYRMRIVAATQASNYGAQDSLCGRYGSGETHDYLIRVVRPVTGVANVAAANTFLSVYPQPAGKESFVALPQGEAGEVTVSDALGRLWLREAVRGTAEKLRLQTDRWPAGTYFVRFAGAQTLATARLLVVH